MAVVSFEALCKSYGRRPAVDGVSFSVEEREVVGLLGPNGSGKSTILRILTGYLRPDAGTVTVDGLDVVRDGLAVRRRIGYVPEDVPLYPHMRVSEFLDFMGRLRGLRGPALRQAIDRAVERLEMQAVRTSVIARLSRGYRQRVSLAQAVLHAPRLLVLDEPTNGLDPRQIIELRGLLRTLAQDCAVLVTSHVLAEIERVADRVAILLDGRLLTLHRLDRAAAGGRFHVTAPAAAADRIAAALRDLPGADVAAVGAAAWTVRLPGPDAGQRLADALAAAGVATVAAGVADSDLETLFLALTGGVAAR